MKVSVEKKGPCRKMMTVELPAERVQDEYKEVLQRSVKVARVPGFRPGRVPERLVESHYGREIKADVQERLVGKTYKEALKQAGIDPVMLLNLEADLQKDQPLVYHLTVDVAPDFKLPRYKGLPVKAGKDEVTDEMVESALQRLLEGNAKYEDAAGEPARAGDLARIDFDAQMDGQPLSALGQAVKGLDQGNNVMVMLSPQGVFLPGLDNEIVGMKVGDEKSFEMVFPDDFNVRGLAGKKAVYNVKVNEVRARKPGVVDAEFLKSLGVEDEAKLREMIRERLLEEMRTQEKERQKEEIIKHLLAKTNLDIPESLAIEETNRVFASQVRRNMMQGMTREQLESQRDELRKTAESSAADRIKLTYIIHQIAAAEQIKVEDAEVDQAIQHLAARYRMTEDQLRKKIEKDQEIDGIRQDVLMNKTLDFLLENAKPGEEGFLSRLMGGGRRSAEEPEGAATDNPNNQIK